MNKNDCEFKGKKVLLKPNLVMDAVPEKAITTNPLIAEAMIKILREKGAASICMGDSPGIQMPSFKPVLAGYTDLSERTGVPWVDFAAETSVHSLYRGIKVNMTKEVEKADIIISLPKAKTHQLMYSTGAVKNMFGTLPGLNKSPLHVKCPSQEEFAKLICSIWKELRPDYALMDAVIAMEGPGPANGTPHHLGLLIGGADGFQVDYAMGIIMGYSKLDLPIVNEGIRERLTDKDSWEWTGLRPEDLIVEDYIRIPVKKTNTLNGILLPLFTRVFQNAGVKKRKPPTFDHDKCILCLRCKQICPAHALSVVDRKISIDTKKCIRCYCCHEMCQSDAIDIKK